MEKETTSGRNYGIDLLRIVATYLIVMFHILEWGGAFNNAHGAKRYLAYFFVVGTFPSVDIFALISGYVCYTAHEKKNRIEKYVRLWLMVCLYNVCYYALSVFLRYEAFSFQNLVRSMLPVSSSAYWYFNAYTGLLFLMPLIDSYIAHGSDKMLIRNAVILVLVFSVYANAAKLFGDAFMLNNGYSTIWLAILYIIGATVKKTDVFSKMRVSTAWIMIAVGWLMSWLCSFLPQYKTALTRYTSPTMVCMALGCLRVFQGIRINDKTKRVIKFLAPATFGAYIIHANQFVLSVWLHGRFVFLTDGSAFSWIAGIILFPAVILIVALMIEKLRLLLFDVLHIGRLTEKLSHIIQAVTNKMLCKIARS